MTKPNLTNVLNAKFEKKSSLNIPPVNLSEESKPENPKYSSALVKARSAHYKKEQKSLLDEELKKFEMYCKGLSKNNISSMLAIWDPPSPSPSPN